MALYDCPCQRVRSAAAQLGLNQIIRATTLHQIERNKEQCIGTTFEGKALSFVVLAIHEDEWIRETSSGAFSDFQGKARFAGLWPNTV